LAPVLAQQLEVFMKKFVCLFFLILLSSLAAACAGGPPPDEVPGNEAEPPGRFAKAEKHGQFIDVNKSVDCSGTLVTIEKALLDKTGTFIIASYQGNLRGRTGTLFADLFDGRGEKLGRSTFSIHDFAPGKKLLTFDAVAAPPQSLRLEFFDGPVGYVGNKPSLEISGVELSPVEKKLTGDYRISEEVDQGGYRVRVDSVQTGVSECNIHYKLTAAGDYDGIVHGWLYDWYNNFSPEGEIISLQDGGRRLAIHHSSLNCLGPFYRVSRDRKNLAGMAYFDSLSTKNPVLNLTNIYGCYDLDEIISLDGAGDRLDINRKIPVKEYTLHLNSFKKESENTWVLDYQVLNSTGEKVDAAIDAGVYLRSDPHRMKFSHVSFKDPAGKDYNLVMQWEGGMTEGAAIKITRLGVRQEDAVVNLNLNRRFKAPWANKDERMVLAAVQDYYTAIGRAISEKDPSIFAEKYGYLQPTGKSGDGINAGIRHITRSLDSATGEKGYLDYRIALLEPIVTISGNKAVADIDGFASSARNSKYYPTGNFGTVFYLEKVNGAWTITMADDFTEEEFHGVN